VFFDETVGSEVEESSIDESDHDRERGRQSLGQRDYGVVAID
jgi:hypothetical protein